MKFATVLGFLAAAIAAPTGTSTSAATSTAKPQKEVYQWDADWNKDYVIHSSCNDTQYSQIYAGLQDTKALAGHARDHTLRYGNSSEFYVKYFGNAPTAEVVGWFESIVNGDHSAAVFRCDNPDGNCNIQGYAGHWRGSNATNENVICDLSYTSRQYLTQVCSQGYTVANSKTTVYWAGDLLHRIWHSDTLGQGVVGHYADTYSECLELAKTNTTEAVRNSATLRYYALDVYAYDIAVPGVGCTGEPPKEEAKKDDKKDEKKTSSKEESKTDSKAAPASTAAATTTTDSHQGGSECHTHADGATHCV